jgi:D-lactate dehydrogenase (cytochrome)
VPISRLADCIGETLADLQASGLTAPLVGHVGDGNFHLLLLADPDDPADMERAKQFSNRLVERAVNMDGTCTGEHGIGLGKRDYLAREHGDAAIEVMRAIKSVLDPENLLNPGKILPD